MASLTAPRPGLVWGTYPQQLSDGPASSAGLGWAPSGLHYRRCVRAVRRAAQSLPAFDAGQAAALRSRLMRGGLTQQHIALALAVVDQAMQHTLHKRLYDTQLQAACVLLDNRLAEMATGEGKTLAIAAAAAVAALAGVPVHVVTANDYLAERDAQTMAPLFQALGLSVAAIAADQAAGARGECYRQDIVYASAKELAFDYLRDSLLPGAHRGGLQAHAAALCARPLPQPVMRGLCMAILDEADSILLDEACVPLVLSQAAPNAARRAFLWQALAVARQLSEADHHAEGGRRQLTNAGRAHVANLTAELGGPWRKPRYRDEAVATALTALHSFAKDRDYLVRDGRIELLDDVSGRVAVGRVWSRGLQTAVELKEGCALSADTDTVAQITFQRFFRRYLRVAGLSGTLREARTELAAVYGLPVVPVPTRLPSRRRILATRLFADDAALWRACAARIAALSAQGRAVLVGTDSVADSESLSACLTAAGIAHRVLNARHDREEAAIVAQAGAPGCVTVATRMAGRGTDIAPLPTTLAAGGLHVLSCQHNPSKRQDRQLWGRCARQGDPGSVETWITHAWERPMAAAWQRLLASLLARLAPRLLLGPPQWWAQRRAAVLRRRLLEQDELWEKQQKTSPV